MQTLKAFVLVTLVGVHFLTYGQSTTPSKSSGELTGKVVDDAYDTVIPGASVKAAQPDGKVIAHTLTERNGSYKIVGLPIGAKLTVTYTKEPSYGPDQHEIVVSANQDGRIMQLHGDQPYYEKKAAKILAEVSLVPRSQREQAWEIEWQAIEKAPIRPAAKGWIAHALQSSAPESLKKSALFAAYATIDPTLLFSLENLQGSRDVANVSPLILENIKAFSNII